MNSRTITVQGIPIRWEEHGSGTPLILVHGIPTSPALWRHVVPRLQGIRCLAFEMVGYGASIPHGRGRDISVASQADYLVAWAKPIGVDSAILAGHDLGGGVVQIAAVRHPEFCRGLLLTNAIGYDSWPIPSVKMLKSLGPIVSRLPDTVARQTIAMLMWRGHDEHARIGKSLQAHWQYYAAHGGGAALVAQIGALRQEDTLNVADRLASLGVPARSVWGAADPFQKIRYGERFARDLNAPLRRIPRGRHLTPEDLPDIVAAELQAFLESVGPFPASAVREQGSSIHEFS